MDNYTPLIEKMIIGYLISIFIYSILLIKMNLLKINLSLRIYEIASLTLIYIIMIFVGLFIDKYLSLNYYLKLRTAHSLKLSKSRLISRYE